jgi:Sulfotransferase family
MNSSHGSHCVMVIGPPRSGTSWVAKALSFAPGFTYYREPDNYDRVEEAEKRFAWQYLAADQEDPAYGRFMTRACAGQIATAFTMREDPGPLLAPFRGPGRRLGERFPALFLRRRHVLLKLVFANLKLEWLAARFPDARQCCLLRHPCGLFESWRRLGWEPQPARLLADQRLVSDHLHPFADLIASASTFWERAGAFWAAKMYLLHHQTSAESPREIVAYEWLCDDPETRVRDLYARLGLKWRRRAARFLERANHEGGNWAYALTRSARKQIDGWKTRLFPEEIDACRRFVEPFGLPYYPGFEPRVASAGATEATEHHSSSASVLASGRRAQG